MIRYEYHSTEERNRIIDENPTLFLVEEQNIDAGNFLIFDTEPTAPTEPEQLSAELAALKVKVQKAEEITSNISVFQQELLELLIETGVL